DLVVSILARVSILYYPTLSLVSKSFRSHLTSPELYQTRSLLGRKDNCLYVCLRFSTTDPKPRWFMLCRRPNTNETRKKKKEKSSGYVLATIPIPHSPPAHGSGLVAVGSNIYKVGGSINGSPSSSVSILDCWSHTWLEAPSMRVKRDHPSANFLDGKIYVTGGCDSSNFMEVYDQKTKIWEPVLSREGRVVIDIFPDQKTSIVVVNAKQYIFGDNVAYNLKDGEWTSFSGWRWSSSFVIENVLYYYYYEEGFKWYDTKFARHANVRLVDYGGKMALFWDNFVASGGGGGYQNRRIWCAMISLERRNNSEEIWGNVEWHDAVLPHPIPRGYIFEHVIAVTV
ncbi:hypothetical protein EUTSA_v10001110mg, partial [Eutrema salsugineum]